MSRLILQTPVAERCRSAAFVFVWAVMIYVAGFVGVAAASQGDVTGDADANIADVQCVVLASLDLSPEDPSTNPECLRDDGAADLDCDGVLSVVDVQLAVHWALSAILGESGLDFGYDQNMDGVHDNCAPAISITVVDGAETGYEGGEVAARVQLRLSRSYPVDLHISIRASGSAKEGEDYSLWVDEGLVSGAIRVEAGTLGADIEVVPIASAEMERDEWLVLRVEEDASYAVSLDSPKARVRMVEYGPSPGAVYHVAENGDDSQDGTQQFPFATVQHALNTLAPGDTVYLHDGSYFNEGFSEDHGTDGSESNDNGVLGRVGLSGSPELWTTIAAYPDGNDEKPKLRFDGRGGLQLLSGSSHIRVSGLEIEGPNRNIKHEWAHAHRWSKEALYSGRGVFTWGPVNHIVVEDCDVHHTPNSGIRFNKADYILVQRNQVSNTTWWSSSAESGIVIATAEHIDEEDVVKILYSGNFVYNNWNFMEFCHNAHKGSTEDVYGNCDYYSGGIIDGQGLYVTRNYETYLHGRMRFENNIAFNNGFGGVVYHKTDRGELVNNLVFMNGAYPGLSNYTGMTVNTSDDLLIVNNIIWARDGNDYALKNNGNALNVLAESNYVVGKTQFGDSTTNQVQDFDDAPELSEVFQNVVGLEAFHPDPDSLSGDSSPAEIDAAIEALALDFTPRVGANIFLDGAAVFLAPPVDIHGNSRPLGAGVDLGPFEALDSQGCFEIEASGGLSCDDGDPETVQDQCHASGVCKGTYPTFDAALLNAGFEAQALGTYSQAQIADDFGVAVYWNNGLDEGRAMVAEEEGERFLRVSYPAGGVGSAQSGCQFKLDFGGAYEELYLSYRVRFREGFDFVKGGKLPGLCGGACNTGGVIPDGSDGWSARIMWRAQGKAVQYMYYPDQSKQYGDDFDWNETGQSYFQAGKWHRVQTRVLMNAPGQSNGVIQSWLDGELVLERDDVRFRDIPGFGVDTLYFSTFFGGADPSWAPSSDESIDFDDIIVSTELPPNYLF